MVKQLGARIADFAKSQSSAQAVEFSIFVALISLALFILSHGAVNSLNVLSLRGAR